MHTNTHHCMYRDVQPTVIVFCFKYHLGTWWSACTDSSVNINIACHYKDTLITGTYFCQLLYPCSCDSQRWAFNAFVLRHSEVQNWMMHVHVRWKKLRTKVFINFSGSIHIHCYLHTTWVKVYKKGHETVLTTSITACADSKNSPRHAIILGLNPS